MDKSFCEKIDREFLIEEYVRGKLQGDLLRRFELHLQECPQHALAVQQEKSLRDGVIEFARDQIRSKIRKDVRPREDIRYAILRYAAFLFVAVVVPLMLYYQFRIFQPGIRPAAEKTGIKATADSTPLLTAPASGISGAATTGSGNLKPETAADRKLSVQIAPATIQTNAGQAIPTAERQEESKASQLATGAKDEQELNRQAMVTAQRALVKPDLAAGAQAQNAPASESVQKEQYAPLSPVSDSSRDQVLQMMDGLAIRGVSGRSGLDDQTIDARITAGQADLLKCTARPDSTIFITVKFTVSRQGLVKDLQIVETNIKYKKVEECIIGKISSWKFTASGHETAITRKIFLR